MTDRATNLTMEAVGWRPTCSRLSAWLSSSSQFRHVRVRSSDHRQEIDVKRLSTACLLTLAVTAGIAPTSGSALAEASTPVAMASHHATYKLTLLKAKGTNAPRVRGRPDRLQLRGIGLRRLHDGVPADDRDAANRRRFEAERHAVHDLRRRSRDAVHVQDQDDDGRRYGRRSRRPRAESRRRKRVGGPETSRRQGQLRAGRAVSPPNIYDMSSPRRKRATSCSRPKSTMGRRREGRSIRP